MREHIKDLPLGTYFIIPNENVLCKIIPSTKEEINLLEITNILTGETLVKPIPDELYSNILYIVDVHEAEYRTAMTEPSFEQLTFDTLEK